eukprot:6438308-Ditylum_brightwellii.AAC.1
MPLMLEADSLYHMHWWVDAPFAVHHNMRSHTGGVLMMRRGAIHAGSTKQKLNTQSSAETEIVGVDDLMPQCSRLPSTCSTTLAIKQHRNTPQ